MDKVRIDKWLWAARFYKTRTLATDDIHKGRVEVNGQEAKPAREVRVGDTIRVRQREGTRVLQVLALSDKRGSAPIAQQLYQETARKPEGPRRGRRTAPHGDRTGAQPAPWAPGKTRAQGDRERLGRTLERVGRFLRRRVQFKAVGCVGSKSTTASWSATALSHRCQASALSSTTTSGTGRGSPNMKSRTAVDTFRGAAFIRFRHFHCMEKI
jgi:ribosome-associated heat shock protein Hsp15